MSIKNINDGTYKIPITETEITYIQPVVFSGCIPDLSTQITFKKIGNIVNATIPKFTTTTTSEGTINIQAGVIPNYFYPVDQISLFNICDSNDNFYNLYLKPTGEIIIDKQYKANIPSGTTFNLETDINFTYIV
jgi:hypothetical protein